MQACQVTHYQKQAQFHDLFLDSKLEEAAELLDKQKRSKYRKARLLYYLNRGVVSHLMQRYEASNYFFEQAHLVCESFSIKPLDEIAASLLNPTLADYRGEDHELLLLHYYKVLNFLQLGQRESALVECRRLNIKLSQLGSKYGNIDKYRRDAFVHTLMGLVYQANHEYNNAFIAYRNAIEIYQDDYKRFFGVEVPEQLKKDLIYTAYKTGFHGQVDRYRREFKLNYDPTQEPAPRDVIFLWHNGLGPIKDVWSIDFALIKGDAGTVIFRNEELGLSFPFTLPASNEGSSIADLELIRVVFPKYLERPLLYKGAYVVTTDGKQQTLELLEDIHAIACKVLKQRMVMELGKSLLRLALKKGVEHQIRKQNQLLGAAWGVFGFSTEQADTRNWQTIPHSIYYTRVNLPQGKHSVVFKVLPADESSCNVSQDQQFDFELSQDQTVFQVVNSPAARSDKSP